MQGRHGSHAAGEERHYRMLGLMLVLSFISMYVLMYSMVNSLQNVYMSVNQVYMAGLMAAPMGLIELALMRGMYPDRKINAVVTALSLAALLAFWFMIRQQTAVTDRQFLRSMIPHHAGAILMCEEAAIQDAEVKSLCQEIISSQQREIAQMKAKLASLDR